MKVRLCLFALLNLYCLVALSAVVHSPRPGGIAAIPIEGSIQPTVTVNGKRALIMRDDTNWVAIIGVPLDHDETSPLVVEIKRSGADIQTIDVLIESASYRVQRLNGDRKHVEPDAESLKRILTERKVIDQALTHWRDVPLRDVQMRPPVPGKRSTSFGSRRIFNDQPRSPHKGMDMSAVTGTPILAPLAGDVAATGDYYFNGNTVILDHGQGLISLYCHLSEIDVEVGQSLKPGELLGKVGATGRVTGAHLHFATYLNGTAVDPSLLLVP